MAVIHLFGPFVLIYKYYRVSIADYIAFNVAFVSIILRISPYFLSTLPQKPIPTNP